MTIYRILSYIKRYSCYVLEYVKFKKASKSRLGLPLLWRQRYPCLSDKSATTGYDRHYLYHTAWAARVLAKTLPKNHVDLGSYLYFSTLVSAFIPIRFYDYRPARIVLSDLESDFADITALPFDDCSIASLSCMHVVEHIGLGRYGDPLDPMGDLKAMTELERVVAPGGHLIFVVPVGKPKVMFNAHRVYSFSQVIDGFPLLELVEFSLIEGDGPAGIINDANPDLVTLQDYGCGCFLFRKPIAPSTGVS